MNEQIRVAVTGAGGGVGQSIIKAMRGTGYGVVALDSDGLAAGLYAANQAYIIPSSSDPSFLDRVLEICAAEGCRLLFPGLDTELPVLASASERFASAGIAAVVSPSAVVDISDDKLLTYQALSRYGIAVPKTVELTGWTGLNASPLPYPYILKKRVGGSRSRDVYLMESVADVKKLISQGLDAKEFIAQEYIDGDEYTCGSVTLGGECVGVIAMRRTLRNGDTYKCFAVRDDVIESEVRRLMNALKPFGACNAQLRIRDGRPYVFEINARCSGTTAARALCGFNEPLMVADYVCHGAKPDYFITEQTILRYWNELVVPNDTVNRLATTGKLAVATRIDL